MFAACTHSEALLYLQFEKHRLGAQQGNFAMESRKCSNIRYLVCRELLLFSNTSFLASFSVTVLSPEQLSRKLTIGLLLKNTIDLLFFSERKLYGFPQMLS